jgi:hypothetical protein
MQWYTTYTAYLAGPNLALIVEQDALMSRSSASNPLAFCCSAALLNGRRLKMHRALPSSG